MGEYVRSSVIMQTTYEQVRDRIQTGDALLFRDHHDGALRNKVERWIVRHVTASPYTHVGIAWVEHGRVWVMDLTTKGCAPRLLSRAGNFDWAAAPKPLSDTALQHAFSRFGELEYSRWEAFIAPFGFLKIGGNARGECAEFALDVWQQDGIAPCDIATPAAVADGVMQKWGASIVSVVSD